MFHLEHSILINQMLVLVLIPLGVDLIKGWCHAHSSIDISFSTVFLAYDPGLGWMFHLEHSILINQMFVLVLNSLRVVPVECWCHLRLGTDIYFPNSPSRVQTPRGERVFHVEHPIKPTHLLCFRGQDTGVP